MSIVTYIPSTQKNSQQKRIPTTKLISTNISYITSEQLHYNTILHYTIFRQHMLQQNTIKYRCVLFFVYIYRFCMSIFTYIPSTQKNSQQKRIPTTKLISTNISYITSEQLHYNTILHYTIFRQHMLQQNTIKYRCVVFFVYIYRFCMSIVTYIPSTQKNSQQKRIPTTKLISTNIPYITSEQLHYNTILHYTIFRQHMLQQNTIKYRCVLFFVYIYRFCMSIVTYIPSRQKNSQQKRIPTTKLISTNISYITSEQLHYNTILHYTIFRQHMLQQNTIKYRCVLFFVYIYRFCMSIFTYIPSRQKNSQQKRIPTTKLISTNIPYITSEQLHIY